MTVTEEYFLSGEPVVNEINELHQFFQQWFRGEVPKDKFNRFTRVLSDDFILITPTAEELDREKIIEAVKNGYNTQSDRQIWTSNIKTRAIDNIVLATYIEHSKSSDGENERISTAVFSYNENGPNYCSWEHTHETWI